MYKVHIGPVNISILGLDWSILLVKRRRRYRYMCQPAFSLMYRHWWSKRSISGICFGAVINPQLPSFVRGSLFLPRMQITLTRPDFPICSHRLYGWIISYVIIGPRTSTVGSSSFLLIYCIRNICLKEIRIVRVKRSDRGWITIDHLLLL